MSPPTVLPHVPPDTPPKAPRAPTWGRILSADEAIAKERAGKRDPPAPRTDGRGRNHDNQPDVYDSIILKPGEKKITEEVDTRLPSASIFTFRKEDHTLANVLRSRLLKTEHVLFAAYKMSHPLKAEFLLRVQTDGEITPKDAVVNASRATINDLGIISREFQKEYELRKAANAANAANQQQNGTEQAAAAPAPGPQQAAVNPQI